MTGSRASAVGVAGLLSVDEATDRILAAITAPLPAERLTPLAALSRVLAEPVVASTSLPPWDNAAMDGYAVRAADTTTATEAEPARLTVIGEVRAGVAPDHTVKPGTAIRIATGAPIPPGADAVVPVELTTPLDGRDQAGPRGRDAAGPLPAACLVHDAVQPGASIRRAGSDLRAGSVVLDRGAVVTAPAVALAAGAGAGSVAVHRRARVGVLATGDEIREPGEALGAAGIPDANRPGLLAHVAAAGAEPVDLGIARDQLDEVLGRLREGLARGLDAIIVSGGVSVGPYDVVKAAFEAIGRIDLWRVAVQPGKPFVFGTAERPGRDEPVAPHPAVRVAGQPGFDGRHVRAVRSPCAPPAGRPRATVPPPRPGSPGRSRQQEPGPAGLPAGRGRAQRCGGR